MSDMGGDFNIVGQMSVIDDGTRAALADLEAELFGVRDAGEEAGAGLETAGRQASFLGGALKFAIGGLLFTGLMAAGQAVSQFASSVFTVGEAGEKAKAQLDAVLKSTAPEYAPDKEVWVSYAHAIDATQVSLDKLEKQEKARGKSHKDNTVAIQETEAELKRLQGLADKGGGGYFQTIKGQVQETRQQVLDLAQALALHSTYSKNSILEAQDLLLESTKIGRDAFPAATQATLDLATAMHEDLDTAAKQVGMALQDPIKGMTMLRRARIDFTAGETAQIKALQNSGDLAGAQAIILKKLHTEFDGAAQAAGDTFPGKIAILNNYLDMLREKIYNAVLPALMELVSWVTNNVLPMILAFVDSVQTNLIGIDGKLAPVLDGLRLFWQQILDIFKRAAPELGAQVQGTLNQIKGFWDKHGKEVLAILDVAFRLIVVVVTEAIQLIGLVIRVGMDIILGVWKVISDILKGDWKQAWLDIQQTGQDIWNAILTFLTGFFNTALSLTGTNLGDFIAMWRNNLSNLYTIIIYWLTQAMQFIRNQVAEWVKAGKNLIDGLLNGLKSAWEGVKKWLGEKAKEAADIWKTITHQQSPSQVFADIGKNMMAGLALGLQQGAVLADSALADIANGITSKAGAVMGGSSNSSTTNNGPTFNLYFNGDPAQKPSWLNDDQMSNLGRLTALV